MRETGINRACFVHWTETQENKQILFIASYLWLLGSWHCKGDSSIGRKILPLLSHRLYLCEKFNSGLSYK